MEKLHLEKVKELKTREQETINRIKEKERQVEGVAYDHRQKVLKDEEILRYKEAEVKKTMEMELLLVKGQALAANILCLTGGARNVGSYATILLDLVNHIQ